MPFDVRRQVKSLLFGGGSNARRILFGPARGLWMKLDPASQSQRLLGLDERELYPWLRRWLPAARSCIDVGANDGYYTMIFLASRAERVIACEPGPVAGALLENAGLNGWEEGGRFSLVRKLVGSGDGCVRMGELLDGLPGPVLVKVDVDGGELDVLSSAVRANERKDIFWIVEVHSVKLEADCVSWMASCGWRPLIVSNAWWRACLPERRSFTRNRWIVAPGRGSATPISG